MTLVLDKSYEQLIKECNGETKEQQLENLYIKGKAQLKGLEYMAKLTEKSLAGNVFEEWSSSY